MKLDKTVSVKSRFPLFWQALYPPHLHELKIPVCRLCGNLIKVNSYDDIRCQAMLNVDGHRPTVCGGTDISFDPSEGAKILPVNQGVFSEFDSDGNETINFRFLPTDGLQAFGLVDPFLSPPTFYLLNLKTGNIEIGNVNTGRAIPMAFGIEYPTPDGRNIIPISTVLDKYGSGGDLIHYKHSEQGATNPINAEDVKTIKMMGLDPNSIHITNIVAGYKCHIPGWHCQIKINVNCKTHIPFITTKATKNEEDWPKETFDEN